ncbi:MAG: 2Fe-2S iron-sulfur cluster-binding protein [Planctomycetota bacterium]
MPKIIIDGQEIEARAGTNVLQAALDAGFDVPHYCYHPGLKVVASCRLCLMQMKMPNPRTKELEWAPKLFPACHTRVRKGMEVRFDSDAVRDCRRHLMEYYLLNHPLDCPVCDKAGECYLQDYTEQYSSATSRMVEQKQKNPKKDIGPHTLLYSDRCVLCKRCTRFVAEIAGTGELAVANRGSKSEIDVLPGVPLDNPLQGNVVDLCPVGALIDKDFLFKQRVWELHGTRSISPADSRGQSIFIDHNGSVIRRIRPRFNEKVNEWWISDEARYGWKHVHREDRLSGVRMRATTEYEPLRWEDAPQVLRERFTALAEGDGGAGIAVVLSPMMGCEEAWLLAGFFRELASQATLVTGYAPIQGSDQSFPGGFVISAEKCPNRRGVERIVEHFGGNRLDFNGFIQAAKAGRIKGAYITGGYPNNWISDDWAQTLAKIEYLAWHDLFAPPMDGAVALQIAGASWAEREGTFMNSDGLLQAFERAIPPLEGIKADGQFFHELAGERGLFRAAQVRARMAAACPEFDELHIPQEMPAAAH